jgi:hypothetical protein
MCINPDCCEGWIEGDVFLTWGGDVTQYATPCPDCTPPRGADDVDSEPLDIEIPEGMEPDSSWTDWLRGADGPF